MSATSARARVVALAPSPVFYQVPLYREIEKQGVVDLSVHYLSDEGIRPYEAGFSGKKIVWHEDLLSGYRSEFLPRAGRNAVEGGVLGLRGHGVERLVRRAREEHASLWLHGFSYLANLRARAAAAALGVPVLVREEQTLLHRRRVTKEVPRRVALRTLLHDVSGLYIGSNNRDFFLRYGVPPQRLFFVPYCVDNEAIQRRAEPSRVAARALRARLGVPPDACVTLFVGKLVRKKRPALLLEAFLSVAGPDDHLLLAGEGPLRTDLEHVARQDGRIHFLGFVNRGDIDAVYAAADLFVLPSGEHETWGLVVNEAMNHGCVVIASDAVGSARDLLQPDGLVFPRDDAQALGQHLQELLGDRDRRAALGARGRERVQQWNYGVGADGIARAARNGPDAG